MGFNIEQYDNNDYSNAVGFGCEFIFNKRKKAECKATRIARRRKAQNFSLKELFGIGDGKIFGKVVSPRKKAYSDAVKQAEKREALADSQYQKNSWSNINGNNKTMGFNLEQYEINVVNNEQNWSNADGMDPYSYANSENWSNGSGKLKSALGIGDGKIFGIVVNKEKNAEYESNKAITSGTTSDKNDATETKVEEKTNVATKENVKTETKTETNPSTKKSNTLLYVGIGATVLVLGVVGYFVFRKK